MGIQGGIDVSGMGLAGSSYLKGVGNNQYNDQNDEDNWSQESKESEPEDYADCEERDEFVFENGAKYKGQWKNSVRHGLGVQIWPDGAKY